TLDVVAHGASEAGTGLAKDGAIQLLRLCVEIPGGPVSAVDLPGGEKAKHIRRLGVRGIAVAGNVGVGGKERLGITEDETMGGRGATREPVNEEIAVGQFVG